MSDHAEEVREDTFDAEAVLRSHYGLSEDDDGGFDFGGSAELTVSDDGKATLSLSGEDAIAIRKALKEAQAEKQAFLSESAALALHDSNPQLFLENAKYAAMIRKDAEKCLHLKQPYARPIDTDAKSIIFGYDLSKIYNDGLAKAVIEIRLLIWEYVSSEPRVVEIRRRPQGSFTTKPFIPSILLVNRETRTAGSRWFKRIKIGKTHTYINFNTDIVYYLPCFDPVFPIRKSERLNSLAFAIKQETAVLDYKNGNGTKVVNHGAINEHIRFLAVHNSETSELLNTIPSVHFKKVRELVVVRYHRDLDYVPLEPGPENQLNFFRATTDFDVRNQTIEQILDKARADFTAHPDLGRIAVMDASRMKAFPFTKVEEEEHLRLVEIGHAKRYESDLLAAARFADELDKRMHH